MAGYSRLAGSDEERTLARHSPKVSVDILRCELRPPKSQQGPFWTPTKVGADRSRRRPAATCQTDGAVSRRPKGESAAEVRHGPLGTKLFPAGRFRAGRPGESPDLTGCYDQGEASEKDGQERVVVQIKHDESRGNRLSLRVPR